MGRDDLFACRWHLDCNAFVSHLWWLYHSNSPSQKVLPKFSFFPQLRDNLSARVNTAFSMLREMGSDGWSSRAAFELAGGLS